MNHLTLKTLFLGFLLLGLSIVKSFSQQDQSVKKASTALIIIDIQNDYFEQGTMTLVGAFEASLNARKVLEKFRKDSLQVVFI
jgi:hypothetical protein